jgi:PAS domain S-box-containing protein
MMKPRTDYHLKVELASSSPAARADNSTHILLVEDNVADQELLRECLSAAAMSADIMCVGSLDEATHAAEAGTFDLVLLDLNLPDSQGISTVKSAVDAFAALPIIALMGCSDEEAGNDAIRAGAQDYLVKGRFTPDMLRRSTRYAIERYAARTWAEEAIKASEQRYRRLFESAKDGILILDAQTGMVVDVNPFMIEMLGYTREHFFDKTIWELGFLKDVIPNKAHFVELQEKEYIRYEDMPLETADGQRINVEFVSNVYLVNHHKVIQCNIRDITDRKQAEEETLRASEERYRILVENIQLGITLIDRDYRIVTSNMAQTRMFSKTLSDLAGKECFRKFVKQDYVCPHCPGKVAMATGQPAEAEYEGIRDDGSRFAVRIHAFPVLDLEGRATSFVEVVEDVTDHKQLEERFIQAQKMEAVGQLAGGVAHDFRNQLTVIKGYGEMLLRRSLVKDEAKGYVAQILKASERSATISEQLLAFSRQQVLRPEVAKLDLLAGQMMKSMAQTFGEDIQVSVVPCNDLWNVRVDAGQFQQALLNLALNARDAMPKGGQLTIETENIVLDESFVRRHAGASAGRYVMLTIRDTGAGMSPKTLGHLFEPFFTTKPVGEGTGLGLAMVYGFVTQSGGFIDVQSQSGKGTTFRIYFPAVDDVPESTVTTLQPTDLPIGLGTLLVVEDEEAIRRILLETLGECGYTVLTAGNAQEAMALVESSRQKIDLLITDVVMPGLSGPELAEHFQAARPGVQVLLISGYTGKMLTGHGVVPPEVNLLIKPFSSQALAQAVQKILGQPRRP